MTATHAKPYDDSAQDHDDTAETGAESETGTGAEVEDDHAEPDFFAVLGVSPTASTAELRQAYRRLAKLWHPDRYAGASEAMRAQAERRMRALTRAYAALSDPVQRSMYALRQAQRDGDAAAPWSGAARSGAPTYHAYGAWSAGDWQDEARANPNGAGLFFGLLALVIGMGLAIGALNAGSPAPLLFGGLALLALLIVAAALFTNGSPLARAANAWIEREPRGYADPYAAARRSSSANTSTTAQSAQRRATRRTTARHGTALAEDDTASHAGEPAADALPTEDTDEWDVTESALALHITPDGLLVSPDERDAARFERYVVAAVESLPAVFRRRMPNMIVRVADEPDAETLRKMCVSNGQTLFGLYEGVPLTQQGATAVNPEVITIYRRPIERASGGDQARLRKQIRKTVFHEVAHHFGIGHEEMPEWVR